MNKRKRQLKKLAQREVKQGVEELEEENKEDELSKFTKSPYGSKLRYKGDGAKTFLLLSHNGKGYFL